MFPSPHTLEIHHHKAADYSSKHLVQLLPNYFISNLAGAATTLRPKRPPESLHGDKALKKAQISRRQMPNISSLQNGSIFS